MLQLEEAVELQLTNPLVVLGQGGATLVHQLHAAGPGEGLGQGHQSVGGEGRDLVKQSMVGLSRAPGWVIISKRRKEGSLRIFSMPGMSCSRPSL